MKATLIIFLTLTATICLSQRRFMFGVVKDSITQEEMIGTHVQNITAGRLAITDAYGKFRMPAQVGDTLVFSNVGYEVLGWVAEESWFEGERVGFLLRVDTIYLEEVVVGEFPEYERFKQIIVETKAEDTSFWYHGMKKPVMEEHTVLEKKDYANPLYVMTHPISFLHHSISKKEKEKRKMQQINKQRGIVTQAEQKFTRGWVSERTRLEGDRLTNFISYCNFSTEYLAKTPLYMIHEKMMAMLDDFLIAESEG